MKIKKANAGFGLLTMLILLAHAGYQIISYLLQAYDPLVTKVLAWACAACLAVHVILAMCIVMFVHEGSTLTKYPRDNFRTVLQRASALGIMITMVLHVKAFAMLSAGTPGLILSEVTQFLFFSFVFTHIATSFSGALVTLGLVENMDTKKRIDLSAYIICGALWLISVSVVGFTFFVISRMS